MTSRHRISLTVAAPVLTIWALHTLGLHLQLRKSRQAIEIARHDVEFARRDALTGLQTRAGWTEQAEQLIRDERAVVLLLDLDYFKKINDTEGHGIGDIVLAQTAKRLQNWCAPITGVPGRLGGDEFVAVALIDADTVHTRVLALSTAISGPILGVDSPVRASIGYALVRDYPDADLGELLRQADAAMYTVKDARNGRIRSAWGLRPPTTANGRRPGRRGTTGAAHDH